MMHNLNVVKLLFFILTCSACNAPQETNSRRKISPADASTNMQSDDANKQQSTPEKVESKTEVPEKKVESTEEKSNPSTEPQGGVVPSTPAPTVKPVTPAVDPKAQPVLHNMTSADKCTGITPNPSDCSKFCTVVVCGQEAGAYDGDLDGDKPIFRFKKKGDQYCGGTGQPVKVEIACRKPGQSMVFEFKNPGAPPSGAANRGSPYRFEKNLFGSKGMLWKSAGDGGRPLVIVLSRDFSDDNP